MPEMPQTETATECPADMAPAGERGKSPEAPRMVGASQMSMGNCVEN